MDELSERMRDFWDDRAREDAFHFVDPRETYGQPDEERFWRRGEQEVDALLEMLDLEIRSSDHVLELGCGVGRLTRVLAERAQHVTAVDVSPEMLAQAQDHHDELYNVEWVLGDGETLFGVEDATVDVVVSHSVFTHIPSPKIQLGYVTEFARVLKPGGWAAFTLSTDPGAHKPKPPASPQAAGHSRRGFLRALVGQAPTGKDKPEWLGSWVPLDALGATATQAGLLLERIEGSSTRRTLVRALREEDDAQAG
jgi:ubiquinone/menaquinone biosynthesis C-methylase UbiE